MALSLSFFPYRRALLILVTILQYSHAITHNFDWTLNWVRANPDGMLDRPVIGVNGQWPWPLLNFTMGDRVIVNLHNQLGNESSSLHFHGLFQNGTTHMDGPVGVTQCDIQPGSSMTYNFTVEQSGTYWYHSHSRGQYPDGFRGQYIITDPNGPYRGLYDEEIALSLSDWYHDEMPGLIDFFISYANPTGAEPVPASALMNDTQNLTVSVESGKTYFFRMVNMGAFAGQYFWIEGHTLTIIEVDGVWTEPAETDMIYLTAAQRCGFLVTTQNDRSANFAMVGSMDQDLFDAVPPGLNPNVTGWLVYNDAAPNPAPALIDTFEPFDDFTLVPEDGMEVFDKVDYSIKLDVKMDNLGDGANYAFFNNITYTRPVVPTLFSIMTTGEYAANPAVYGDYTNAYVLKKNEVVEIILNNDDPGKHPFHLHGHNFQVVVRSDDNMNHYNPANESKFPARPMRRDTLLVRPNSNFVVRFRADNPGVWFFHCHINWHLDSGLAATMIEAPIELQETLQLPDNHFDVCRASDTKVAGNAAGNIVSLLDLKGQNESPAPLPAGFTARGIVALVFSCLSAALGMAAIAWYGAAPLGSVEMASAQAFVAKVGGTSK